MIAKNISRNSESEGPRYINDFSYYRRLLILALPIVLQNLLSVSVDLIDNLTLGRLGDLAVSAAYLSNQANQVQYCLITGLTAAIMILGSQYWGRGDQQRVKQIISIAWRIGVGAAVSFALLYGFFPRSILNLMTQDRDVVETAIPYIRLTSLSYVFLATQMMLISSLRIAQIMRMGTIVTALALVSKLILNPFFVFHLNLGLTGAALSSLIVRVCGAGVVSYYVLVRDHRLGFRLSDLKRFDPLLAKNFMKYGIPVILGDLTWGINVLARSAIRGHLGSEATAAVSVATTLFAFLTVSIAAFRDVVSIEIGRTVGQDNLPLLKRMTRSFQLCFLVSGIIHSLLLLTAREPFLMLYPELSDAARYYAWQYIGVLSVTVIGSAYQTSALTGIVRAGGQTSFVLYNDLIFCWLVVMPLSLLAANVLHAPVWVVLLCLESDQILKSFVALIKVNRYRWVRNLTQ